MNDHSHQNEARATKEIDIRRVKLVQIKMGDILSILLLQEMLPDIIRLPKSNLPDGFKVLHVACSVWGDWIDIIVHHPSFDPVPDGEVPPLFMHQMEMMDYAIVQPGQVVCEFGEFIPNVDSTFKKGERPEHAATKTPPDHDAEVMTTFPPGSVKFTGVDPPDSKNLQFEIHHLEKGDDGEVVIMRDGPTPARTPDPNGQECLCGHTSDQHRRDAGCNNRVCTCCGCANFYSIHKVEDDPSLESPADPPTISKEEYKTLLSQMKINPPIVSDNVTYKRDQRKE